MTRPSNACNAAPRLPVLAVAALLKRVHAEELEADVEDEDEVDDAVYHCQVQRVTCALLIFAPTS